MFYFLISACQTVSVVNGHRERNRAQEEGERRETKVLWNLGKETRGCFCPPLWQDGQPDKNNSRRPSLCCQKCWRAGCLHTPSPALPHGLHPASLSFDLCSSLIDSAGLSMVRGGCFVPRLVLSFSRFLRFIILFIVLENVL